jgi:type I restriction enzyme S subunit
VIRQAKLGEFLAKRSRGIVPASTPDETFELYSVPAFEGKRPEVVTGGQIGSNKQIVDPGTVLLCKINPRINRAWVVGSFTKHQKIASTEWITFPPHADLEPRYLAHYLSRKEIRDHLAANASGVGGSLMRVKASTVEGLPLPLPNVDQQRRIVAELEKQFSRLDEAVANLKRVNANVSRYKDAVLTAAVQGKLVWKTAVDSDQGHDLLARIRQSRKAAWIEHGGGRSTRPYRAPPNADEALRFEIPNHWAIATVDELTPADRACAYGVLQPGDDTADGVPFIRVGDVHDGVVDIDTLKRIQPSIAAQYPRTQLEGGEILITIVGTIGRTAVVPRSLNGANVARAIGVIPLTAMVNPWWVSLWFESPAVRLRMTSAAHEVARKTLNLEDVRRAPVAIPPLNEQDQIVQAADQALSLVGKTREELNLALIRARRLRDAVLAAAFSSSPTSRT